MAVSTALAGVFGARTQLSAGDANTGAADLCGVQDQVDRAVADDADAFRTRRTR